MEYSAFEMHDRMLRLWEVKTEGDQRNQICQVRPGFGWSPTNSFWYILLTMRLAHHLLIELSDTGLLKFVHESDLGHGPF